MTLFLIGCALGFAILIILFRIIIDLMDTSSSHVRLVPFEKPDPFQAAYLRGGINEIVRLAIFELRESGQLTDSEDGFYRLQATETLAPQFAANPFEEIVHRCFKTPATTYHMLHSLAIAEIVDAAQVYVTDARERRLVTSPELRQVMRWVRKAGVALICLVGFRETLYVARHLGWYGGSLATIPLTAAGIGFCLWLVRPFHISRAGRAYLNQFQKAAYAKIVPAVAQPGNTACDPPVLLFGLFGLRALSKSDRKTYKNLFGYASLDDQNLIIPGPYGGWRIT